MTMKSRTALAWSFALWAVCATGQQSFAATEMVIYRISGVYDFSLFAKATAVHCTNYDAVSAMVRVKFRNEAGRLVGNLVVAVVPNGTATFATNDAETYTETLVANTGPIEQGMAIVSATTKKVVCSANGMWRFGVYPAGLALHMVRFNQAPGQID
jgi:hypothetical protein